MLLFVRSVLPPRKLFLMGLWTGIRYFYIIMWQDSFVYIPNVLIILWVDVNLLGNRLPCSYDFLRANSLISNHRGFCENVQLDPCRYELFHLSYGHSLFYICRQLCAENKTTASETFFLFNPSILYLPPLYFSGSASERVFYRLNLLGL